MSAGTPRNGTAKAIGHHGGARVRAEFPAPPRVGATDDPGPQASSPDPAGRILVAEDEEVIRRAAKRLLERYGYIVVQAADGVEALERLAEHGNEMDLVISDIVMPRLDGLELHRNARGRGCVSPFLFMSGYQEAEVGETVDGDPTLDFLPKPWTVPELLARVGEILGRRRPDPAGTAEAGR